MYVEQHPPLGRLHEVYIYIYIARTIIPDILPFFNTKQRRGDKVTRWEFPVMGKDRADLVAAPALLIVTSDIYMTWNPAGDSFTTMISIKMCIGLVSDNFLHEVQL